MRIVVIGGGGTGLIACGTAAKFLLKKMTATEKSFLSPVKADAI